MDQQQNEITPPKDEAPVVASVEVLKPRRSRRERALADRAGTPDEKAAERVAGEQAIERIAETARRLAEFEKEVAASPPAAKASSPAPNTSTSSAPTSSMPSSKAMASNTLASGTDRSKTARLPAPTSVVMKPLPPIARRGRITMPIYAAALCMAIGVGGLLGGHFGPTIETAVANAAGEKDEAVVIAKREIAQSATNTRDEIKALRAEIAALRTNNDQLGQADAHKHAGEIRALRATLEAQKAETASLKADTAARFDRAETAAVERQEKAVERIDRLERRSADPTTTASIAKPAPESAKVEKPPVQGIILRDVARGVALIETRRGLMEVAPGDTIPGAGRVESIERRGGKWKVVTSMGVIDDAAN